jgi:hypothetical protein
MRSRFIVASQVILALLYKVLHLRSFLDKREPIVAQQCLPTMTLVHFCSNMIRGPIVVQLSVPTMGVVASHCCSTMDFHHADKHRHDQPIRCYSLTLGREEHFLTFTEKLKAH